jgi:hypothetical protein
VLFEKWIEEMEIENRGLDEAISTQNRSNDYPSLHLSIPYLNLLRNSSLSVETYFPMVASTFHPWFSSLGSIDDVML